MDSLSSIIKREKSNELVQGSQRKGGTRRLAGCLPFDGKTEQFILITARHHSDTWVFPRGEIQPEEDFQKAAMRMAWEEAGIRGIVREYVGVFAEKVGTMTVALCHVYALEIRDITDKFPEKHERRRRWFGFDDAIHRVIEPHLKAATHLAAVKIRTQKLIMPEVHLHYGLKHGEKKDLNRRDQDHDLLLDFNDVSLSSGMLAASSKASHLSKRSESSSQWSESSKTSKYTDTSGFSDMACSSQTTSLETSHSGSADISNGEQKNTRLETNPIKIWKDKDLFAPIVNPDQIRGKTYAMVLEERLEHMKRLKEKEKKDKDL
ncbi:hypothetical protein EC973_000228 [Apophysomyces ossiformis]|uniref:Nudix hydrolase domain-containing protein n=1 Tax=Apophysomyces ossiformis TaxID=679940 RepID=A0A8H7BUU0_9FUNG|nr:hypothetical protein EC973_000228 [Apophysomyces ossiformis]